MHIILRMHFLLKQKNHQNQHLHFVSVHCCSFAIGYTSNAPLLVISCLRVAKGKLLGSGYNGGVEIIRQRHVELAFCLCSVRNGKGRFFGGCVDVESDGH